MRGPKGKLIDTIFIELQPHKKSAAKGPTVLERDSFSIKNIKTNY
jgi:hypothetical protein